MATFTNITLAGGIKAPAVTFGPPSGQSASALVIGFSTLSDLIAEAAAAQERLGSAWSFDPAASSMVEADEMAIDAAYLAAQQLRRMPCMLPTDRPLLTASRFLLQGLALDCLDARAEFRFALQHVHPFDLTGRTRHLTVQAARMIDLAMSRLWWLFGALDADTDCEADLAYDTGLDALALADQEVQAF